METKGPVFIFDTPEQLAKAPAERFVEYSRIATAEHGLFAVALSGGNTPRRVYELLATDSFRNRINWPMVHLFFGDERSVPPDHPDSNYRMVYEALISRVAIPAKNVHPIMGEGDPDENARAYERELKSFFAGLSWPRFDLTLLGLGEDGHTASLFPGTDAVEQKSKWVVAVYVAGLETFRITLTIPVFNHTAHIVFLVTGKQKAKRLAQVVQGTPDIDERPAQKIQPVNGSLEWLVDKAAASLL